ncbi:MAG: SMP-30/gluconolactonase/LRE family protein [Burkholderiales bacterium]|nr:SMP-30/gluconolactonase/LRE family protein [Burkholderiales bacterium]
MKTRLLFSLLLALLGASAGAADSAAETYGKPELQYAWTRSMWEFRNEAERQDYLAQQIYKKAPLHGVKLDRHDNIYLSVARILDGRVPATLNRLIVKDGVPLLQPFPDWQSNRLGDPQALQNVLGFAIDKKNRMWILDQGFAGGVEQTPDGAQKIVVLDLDSGQELKRFTIADDLADRNTSFLNDIVVDERRQLAYLSDSGSRAAGRAAGAIIVYDFKTNSARRVLDRSSVTSDDRARPLQVNGEAVFPGNPLKVGINGITLSPDGRRLYWSITTGDAVYSVATRHLRDASMTDAQLQKKVRGPLRIGGGSDGLTIDDVGQVYITNISKNALQMFDPKSKRLRTLASGADMVWPDSMGWDSKGGLWLSTNHLNHAFAGTMDFDTQVANFRLWRIQTPHHRLN